MPFIHLTTFIAAPVERVFDLSRSIELHKHSMKKFELRPVAGRISGLMESGDTITWNAKHFKKKRVQIIKVVALEKPSVYIEEQTIGDLKVMKHEHYFKPCNNGSLMIDQLTFEFRDSFLGRLFNNLYLTNYMNNLLEERNSIIKEVAESNRWKHFLIV